MATEFDLSEADRAQTIPSGRQTTLTNRTHWAVTYLKEAGLVDRPRRGVFTTTARGDSVLAEGPERINLEFLSQFQSFRDFKSRRGKNAARSRKSTGALSAEAGADIDDKTPEERLQSGYDEIVDALSSDLLDRLRASTPSFFEKVIVTLLVAMGYGGTADSPGRQLGQSGDGGVDGVVDQDPLGVDQIYIQAKRYGDANLVGPGAIRDFFGALSLRKATKGIFVTTSSFTEQAKTTAGGLGSRIVLIDGDTLARLMVSYDIGCRVQSTLAIKTVDDDFFDE